MGGEYYTRTVQAETDEEAVAQFEKIVEECKYEHGHRGYTGTFAEKSKIEILPPPLCRRFPTQPRNYWTITELDLPVMGSTRSCMVTPSTISPNLAKPPISLTIGIV